MAVDKRVTVASEVAFKEARKYANEAGYGWAISDRLCRELSARVAEKIVEALDELDDE